MRELCATSMQLNNTVKYIHILKPVSLTLNQTKPKKNVEYFLWYLKKTRGEGKRARERERKPQIQQYNNTHSTPTHEILFYWLLKMAPEQQKQQQQ